MHRRIVRLLEVDGNDGLPWLGNNRLSRIALLTYRHCHKLLEKDMDLSRLSLSPLSLTGSIVLCFCKGAF